MSFDAQERSNTDGNKVELYKFETADGIYEWGYTTSKVVEALGSFACQPEVISRSEVKQSVGEGPSTVTIQLPYDLPVATINVPYLSPNPIRISIYEFHRNDPLRVLRQIFTGYISSFEQRADMAELSCSQIIDNIKQDVPWATHKSNCNWALYGVGCEVDRPSYEIIINDITFADKEFVEAPSIAAQGNDWFTNGYAVDVATGEGRFIISNVDGRIRFNYPFRAVTPESILLAYAGCDRTRQTCLTKFANIANYFGFDWLPDNNVFETGVQ